LTQSEVWLYLGNLVVFIGVAGLVGLAMVRADLAPIQASGMHGSAKRRSLSVAVGGLAVMAAPFISAAGTNNKLAGALVFAATLWAVVLGIALVLLSQRAAELGSSARSVPLLLGCAVMLVAALAVKAHIDRPYRTLPLLSQKTPTSVPELRGMLLSKADAEWLDWVAAAGRSLGARDVPATAIGSPAALYVFNHSAYADPWLDHRSRASMTSLRQACTTRPPSDLFVLVPGSQPAGAPSTLAFKKSLAACGIRYSGDLRVVARRASSDPRQAMTIWRLRGPAVEPNSRQNPSGGR